MTETFSFSSACPIAKIKIIRGGPFVQKCWSVWYDFPTEDGIGAFFPTCSWKQSNGWVGFYSKVFETKRFESKQEHIHERGGKENASAASMMPSAPTNTSRERKREAVDPFSVLCGGKRLRASWWLGGYYSIYTMEGLSFQSVQLASLKTCPLATFPFFPFPIQKI